MSVLRSEWIKLWTLRANRVLLAGAVVSATALSTLLAVVLRATEEHWTPADRASFEPIGTSLIGGVPLAILLLVVGIKAWTGEARTLRLTFAATPRRGRVLAAKAAVVAAVTLVAGLAANLAMFLVTQAIIAPAGLPTAGLGEADALRAIVVGGLLTPVFPVIALALASLIRSTAATVLAMLAVILGPPALGGLLPDWWDEHVLRLAPGAAQDAVAIGQLPDTPEGVAAVAGLGLVAAWLALFLGAAWLALERRDA